MLRPKTVLARCELAIQSTAHNDLERCKQRNWSRLTSLRFYTSETFR